MNDDEAIIAKFTGHARQIILPYFKRYQIQLLCLQFTERKTPNKTYRHN